VASFFPLVFNSLSPHSLCGRLRNIQQDEREQDHRGLILGAFLAKRRNSLTLSCVFSRSASRATFPCVKPPKVSPFRFEGALWLLLVAEFGLRCLQPPLTLILCRYVSCVLGCPYEGYIDPDTVAKVSKKLLEMGTSSEHFDDEMIRLMTVLLNPQVAMKYHSVRMKSSAECALSHTLSLFA